MKTLYLIGGTMGVGKTTTCQILKKKLHNCVFLDGDWCWDMNPFQVTEETKTMVMNNICYMLNSFLQCSAYEHVVFCWVMHEQAIIDEILERITRNMSEDCEIKCISLICNEDRLEERLQHDVDRNIRTKDVIARSVARIPLYEKLDTIKLDVSYISAEEAAQAIIDNK